MKNFRILTNLAASAILAICSFSVSAGTLSQLPLSLKSGVPPNIMFALSVEFPTAITPAYQDTASYSRSKNYLGYFDNTKCYNYGASRNSGSVTGWFYPTGSSTGTSGTSSANACANSWSGNFLNWASMAGLDEFRYAMTGGNRVVDLPNSSSNPGGLTVLERSNQTGQGSNFITKTFTEDGATTGYPNGTSLTITNNWQGVQMSVSQSGAPTDTAVCTTSGGTHGCDAAGAFTFTNSGETATCQTWSGSGTLLLPYKCTAFYQFSTGAATTNPPTAVTVSQSVSGGTAGTVAANCTAMYSGSPTCTFTLGGTGSTGSCSTWAGTGADSSHPYTCASFGSFSTPTEVFSASSFAGAATFTSAGTATAYKNTNVTCTFPNSATATGTNVITSCPTSRGNTATCSGAAYTGTGGSGSNRYVCNTFSVASPAGDTITAILNNTGGASAGSPSLSYRDSYNFTENLPGSATTVYYSTTYTGTYASTGTYYYSSYTVSYASSDTYNVRVQVCNPNVVLESDCTLYGDGLTYKPTGVLQNNPLMRFGVTSYFMNTGGNSGATRGLADIDDAVLRAKAKYLAPQQYLSAGSYTPNLQAEWSATDGTFVFSPDSVDTATMTTPWGTAPANSGVINYINKFGTTAGYYKTWDDIGKLYYETLKYLRGGNYTGATSGPFTPTPTAAFYNGATQANSDGFPVITTWDDPVQYSCQKNYIITMGDAHTWCDKRLPGGTYSSNGSTVCNAYTDGNGNAHPSDLGSLSGDTGITGTINGTTIPSATGTAAATNVVGSMEGMGAIATTQTGAGGASFYMAGLAAWSATNNIRPDLTTSASPMHVKSFVIDVQEAGDCAYQKQFWLTSKYGDPASYTFSSTGASTWNGGSSWYNSIAGNSISCSSNSPPNYATASSMSWPKSLLRAGDPVSMINSVKSAIQSIAAEQGAESALSQSAGTLNTGTGAYIYQGTYNSGGWTGDLKAFVITQTGSVTATPDWSASQNLPNPSARLVFSFSRGTSSGDVNHYAGIQFALDSSSGLSFFDSYQQGLLNTNNLGAVDSFGADRVMYLKGDMTNEAYLPSATGVTNTNTLANHGWRSRLAEGSACNYTVVPNTCPTSASYTAGPTGQLGDIVSSNPVYVGGPTLPLQDASYKSFALAHASRTPMVYVGGNDGMLHAYDASYNITSSTGLPTHTSTSGDEKFAYVPYATYPTLSNLMSTNYAHTYYVDGSPLSADACFGIGGACNGTGDTWKTILVGGLNAGGQGIYALDITDPVASFSASNVLWEFTNLDDPDLGYTFSQPIVAKLNNGRWAVIFGNGFNSVDATGNPNNNKAYLFILYVDPGLSSSQNWTLNTNYFKIPLTSPGIPNNASNGLAGVTSVDTNQDDKIDFVYGGDRNGNMWKIDLTSSTPSAWGSAFSGAPLFSAKDAAGHLQQITTAPKVGINPNGGYMVMFGTGSWIDTADTNLQSGYTDTLYGIWDQNSGATSSPATGRSVLQPQATIGSYSIDNTGATCTSGASCITYTVQSSCEPNYTTTPMADPGNGLTGNQTNLCPQYVPTPPAYSTNSTVLLASPTGTTEQFGWFIDLPGNGERSHSNPPSLIGTNIQFTSLTPSTNPCTGNTLGFEYNFNYLTGGAPSPIFILPGTTSLTDAGTVSLTLPGSSTPTKVVLSGKALSGGAAQNPITFNANTQAALLGGATVTPPAGMPATSPGNCTPGNCTAANYYIPGWGFLMNLSGGPSSSAGRVSVSCTNNENGTMSCTPRLRPGQFGRLSWKQIN